MSAGGDYLAVTGVSKSFQGKGVLHALDLGVRKGELVSLLGPSGCGKTTLLRLIAGLEHSDAGRIALAGKSLEGVATHKRNVGVVFQSYALFPHLTVEENVAFGLRQRGHRNPQALAREMLARVHLGEFAERPVHALSGGQQQRVAVARALATRPDLLLLDEPFSALDKKLREAMQIELRRLLQEVGMTAIFVTHDQDEALALSDRIAVMNLGRIEQYDAPEAVYSRPRTPFVLDFVGLASRWRGRVAAANGGGSVVETGAGRFEVPARLPAGAEVQVAVRPEKISLAAESRPGTNEATLTLRELVYQGQKTELHFEAAEGDRAVVVAGTLPRSGMRPGEQLRLVWNVADSLVYQRDALVAGDAASAVRAAA